MAAVSEPWPPAFMRTAPPDRAGHPDGPLEAGQAGGGRAAGQHREAQGAPGPHRRCPRWPGRRTGPEGDGQAVEARRRPPAGWSPCRPPAPAPRPREGTGPPPAGRPRPPARSNRAAGAPDPVGGERPQGMVPLGRGAEGPGQPVHEASSGLTATLNLSASAMSSSGSEVRSPAPRVSTGPRPEEAADDARRRSDRPAT